MVLAKYLLAIPQVNQFYESAAFSQWRHCQKNGAKVWAKNYIITRIFCLIYVIYKVKTYACHIPKWRGWSFLSDLMKNIWWQTKKISIFSLRHLIEEEKTNMAAPRVTCIFCVEKQISWISQGFLTQVSENYCQQLYLTYILSNPGQFCLRNNCNYQEVKSNFSKKIDSQSRCQLFDMRRPLNSAFCPRCMGLTEKYVNLDFKSCHTKVKASKSD